MAGRQISESEILWGCDGVVMGMGMINAAEIAFGFASEQQLQWPFLTAG